MAWSAFQASLWGGGQLEFAAQRLSSPGLKPALGLAWKQHSLAQYDCEKHVCVLSALPRYRLERRCLLHDKRRNTGGARAMANAMQTTAHEHVRSLPGAVLAVIEVDSAGVQYPSESPCASLFLQPFCHQLAMQCTRTP